MDWIGVALAIVGVGLGLLPLAVEHFPEYLHTPALYGAIALMTIGFLLFFVPVWKRAQAKRRPVPLAVVLKLIRSTDSLKHLHDVNDFGDAVSALAIASLIKVYGVRGELMGVDNRLVEIPPVHFREHDIWVGWFDDGFVSETVGPGKGWAAIASDAGRYYNLHASRNILEQLAKYEVSNAAPDEKSD